MVYFFILKAITFIIPMSRKGYKKQDEKNIAKVEPELKDYMPTFVENRKNNIISIKKLLKKGNYKEIECLAHRLRGVGGLYGCEQITNIGYCIEEAAKNSDSEKIKEMINELSSYLRCLVW